MKIQDLMKGIIAATPSKQFTTMTADKTNRGRVNRVTAQHKTTNRVAAKAAAANQMRYKPK